MNTEEGEEVSAGRELREALRRWFADPAPALQEYLLSVKLAWDFMNKFFEWGCVERRGQRPLVPRGEETAVHIALLYLSNFLLFSFAVPATTLLALAHIVCTMPALVLCAAGGARRHMRCCLAGLAVPDDEDAAQGWAWLLILPVVGGSLLLAWLVFTVVWAPSVFMMALTSSPLWAPCFFWASWRGFITWRQAANYIRIVALWPAYYIYVLGFFEFEDDYAEGGGDGDDNSDNDNHGYGGTRAEAEELEMAMSWGSY